MNSASAIRSQLALAAHAAEDKKAENIAILQMEKSSSAFTDYFLITSGSNPKQVQAIADEVELRLKRAGNYPNSIEGYKQAEWVLIDYIHFVVHVFTESARKFYDLERLWKAAKRLSIADLGRRASSQENVAASANLAARRKPAKSSAARATAKAIRGATSRRKPVVKKTAKKSASSSRARKKK